jgi:hypothetical protein
MNYYVQETDSRIIYELPSEIHYSLPSRLVNETLGKDLYINYLPIPIGSDLFRAAWELAHKIENESVAKDAKRLLSILQETISAFHQFQFDVHDIPPMQAFIAEDGSALFEWIFRDYRIGFNIERNPQDSGWFLVTNRKLGEISACGFLSGVDMNPLILWLLNFVLSHS